MTSDPIEDFWVLVENSIDSISAAQEERSQIESELQQIQDESKWSIARVRRMKRKAAAMRAECSEEMEETIDRNAEDAA